MKQCSKCFKVKSKELFKKDKRLTSGIQSYCKECATLEQLIYSRTIDGLITNIYGHQVSKSKQRGHASPHYTKDLLRLWMLSHKNFNRLYDEWQQSEYDVDKKLSIDRLKNDKGYSFDNIQLVTWAENNHNGRITKRKQVNQYSKDGIFIEKHDSIKIASIATSIERRNINAACKGKLKSAGGYSWEYDAV